MLSSWHGVGACGGGNGVAVGAGAGAPLCGDVYVCTLLSPRTASTVPESAVGLTRGRSASAHRLIADAERLLAPTMRRMRVLTNAVRALYRIQLEAAEPTSLSRALERLRAEHFGGLARLISALPLVRPTEASFTQLTPAEREILQLLARGASTKAIASETGRSPQTVDTHVRAICRKLACSGRREAVALAAARGWTAV